MCAEAMNADAATIRAGLKVVSSLLITLLAVNLLGVVGNSLAYGGFSFGVLLRFALLVMNLLVGLQRQNLGQGFSGAVAAGLRCHGADRGVWRWRRLWFVYGPDRTASGGGALSLFVMPQVNAYFEYVAAQG